MCAQTRPHLALATILTEHPHKTLSAWRQLIAMPPGRKLLYIAAVPVLIGLYFGWFKADQGGQDLMVRTVLVPYWIGFFQLGWLSVILATLLGYELMKPWRPPLWVLSLLAPAAFSWLGAYVINAYIGTLNAQFPDIVGKLVPHSPHQIQARLENRCRSSHTRCPDNYDFDNLHHDAFEQEESTFLIRE